MKASGRSTIKVGPPSGRTTVRSAGPTVVVNPFTRAYPALGPGGVIQTTLRHPEAAAVARGSASPAPGVPEEKSK
jgi:hypothetical protein